MLLMMFLARDPPATIPVAPSPPTAITVIGASVEASTVITGEVAAVSSSRAGRCSKSSWSTPTVRARRQSPPRRCRQWRESSSGRAACTLSDVVAAIVDPSMTSASTWSLMSFSEAAPAPLKADPYEPPTANALICGFDVAVTLTTGAVTLEASTVAVIAFLSMFCESDAPMATVPCRV